MNLRAAKKIRETMFGKYTKEQLEAAAAQFSRKNPRSHLCCILMECSHASLMRRMLFVALVLLAMAPTARPAREPWENAYVMKMIDATEPQEQTISRIYDYFLRLIAGGTMDRGTTLPTDKRFFTETETHAGFVWAFYISPNELRGFEISIPKELLQKKGETYTTLVELQAAEIRTHQDQKIITLKRATSTKPKR